MRLEQKTILSTASYLWPEDGSADQGLINSARFNRYRFDFSGAGAAAATVEYKVADTAAFVLVTPPIDWAQLETWIAAGVYQLRVTAVSGDIVADIDAYQE